MVKEKRCSKCGEIKAFREFYKQKKSKLGYKSSCKKCCAIQELNSRRKIYGLISQIYFNQRKNSIHRKHPMPSYTQQQLIDWIENMPQFNVLYNNWVKSSYKKELIPSIDRIDDYKPYTLDNIQLMTWQENDKKGSSDIRNGKNIKNTKKVCQYNINEGFIKEYYSIQEAGRQINISPSNICMVCKGQRNTAGGFIWKYKNQ